MEPKGPRTEDDMSAEGVPTGRKRRPCSSDWSEKPPGNAESKGEVSSCNCEHVMVSASSASSSGCIFPASDVHLEEHFTIQWDVSSVSPAALWIIQDVRKSDLTGALQVPEYSLPCLDDVSAAAAFRSVSVGFCASEL